MHASYGNQKLVLPSILQITLEGLIKIRKIKANVEKLCISYLSVASKSSPIAVKKINLLSLAWIFLIYEQTQPTNIFVEYRRLPTNATSELKFVSYDFRKRVYSTKMLVAFVGCVLLLCFLSWIGLKTFVH